jgi:CRP-like cAMP-binding protein
MKAPARSADRPSDQAPARRIHGANEFTRRGDGVGIELAPKPLDRPSGNRLLAVLSPADRELVRPNLEFVPLEVRQILERPGEPISHAHFVDSGLVSMIGVTTANRRIEVGMVGYEGVTGLGVVLGAERSANEALVQSSGAAWRISTPALREVMARSPTFAETLLRYVHVFMVQANHTAIAAGRGKIHERLARGLLMWQDRVRDDELSVTHDFLALLLGVRRPGVTVALHELEGKGLIRSTRNMVRILDRGGLQRAARGYYGAPEAEYDRSIGDALL